MNDLSQKIIATIAYYDVMDYPMTSFEIWKYLLSWNIKHEAHNNEEKRSSLHDVIKELESEELKKRIEEYCGYYFLKGRRDLVEQRLERNKIVQIKLKIVKKVVWFLRFVPFVRMIAVTGTMAMKNSEKKGDLDLLVILKHGHIFTGRLLVTFMTHILGKRRYADKITDRACLNFFATEKSLCTDFGKIFDVGSRPDIEGVSRFCASEHFFILTVFDLGFFNKFQRENHWIKNYFENFDSDGSGNMIKIKDSIFSKSLRKIGEIIMSAGFIENWMRDWQMRRIMNDPRTHQAGSMVMANDNYLIFLPKPQGGDIYEKFREKMAALDAIK